MARDKTILPAVALLLFCPCGLVNGTDVVENLFPTYPDDMKEQGRLSVISLSGSSPNVTLNLSGIVILGLALSAAVTLWAYALTVLQTLSPTQRLSHESSLYKKRSLVGGENYQASLPFNNIRQRFEDAGVSDPVCHERVVCQIGSSYLFPAKHEQTSFERNVNTYFSSNRESEEFHKLLERNHQAKMYFLAWNEGSRGEFCDTVYSQCSMTTEEIIDLIRSKFSIGTFYQTYFNQFQT